MRIKSPQKRLALLSLAVIAGIASANPQGGTVVAGNVNINPTDSSGKMVIDQSSNRAIVNWNSFSIGSNEAVRINQPGADSVHLSRVVGQDPSQILGELSSNGKVFLINPNGIMFGQGAKVDTAGLVASTLNIKDEDFLNSHYHFQQGNTPAGVISNYGRLSTIGSNQLISLIAPQIKNEGIINAELGQVYLGAGTEATLTIGNNELLGYSLTEPLVVMNQQGQLVQITQSNMGQILANGGQVYITAAGAHEILNNVVNMDGVVEANSMQDRHGEIVMYAKAGNAQVSGSLQAQGGKIGVFADNRVTLTDSSQLDVSSTTGNAGSILVGGPAAGVGNVPKAQFTDVQSGARLSANSTTGNGGQIVLWSDNTTKAHGTLTATSLYGKGGMIETSAHKDIDFSGIAISTKSQYGDNGLWLIDPEDITIDDAKASTIQSALGSNNVMITTDATKAGNGDITLNSAINYTGDNSLTLSAYRNINFASMGSISHTGSGTLTLRADNTAIGTGSVNFNGSGTQITKNGGALEIYYNPTGTGAAKYSGTDKSTIDADRYAANVTTQNAASLDSYMLVNNAQDLGYVSSTVNSGNNTGKYALGKDIALATPSSDQSNFAPIGNENANFMGNFNGQNYTVSNITIKNPSLAYLGFFGYMGDTSLVQNLKLKDMGIYVSSENTNNNVYIGGIAGFNFGGTIINSSLNNPMGPNSAVLGYSGNNATNLFFGGLVGQSTGGLISNSYANSLKQVTSAGTNPNIFMGGLVGVALASSGNKLSIENSYSQGGVDSNVSGGNQFLGGLIGIAIGNTAGESGHNLSIDNTYSQDYAKSNNEAAKVGGFIGSFNGDVNISNSYWYRNDTDVNGNKTPLGEGNLAGQGLKDLSYSDMANLNNFTGFNTDTWSEGNPAPVLKSHALTYTPVTLKPNLQEAIQDFLTNNQNVATQINSVVGAFKPFVTDTSTGKVTETKVTALLSNSFVAGAINTALNTNTAFTPEIKSNLADMGLLKADSTAATANGAANTTYSVNTSNGMFASLITLALNSPSPSADTSAATRSSNGSSTSGNTSSSNTSTSNGSLNPSSSSSS